MSVLVEIAPRIVRATIQSFNTSEFSKIQAVLVHHCPSISESPIKIHSSFSVLECNSRAESFVWGESTKNCQATRR